jgi:uncharacterized protein (TIGR00369 family)
MDWTALMPLAGLLGLEVIDARPERVEGRLTVRPELCTADGVLHGGAVMAAADSLGAIGAVLNLPAGARTTTIESKTNFVGAAAIGDTLRAVAAAAHVGRRTSVWQTCLETTDGKLVALVTQTQLTLDA